MALFYGLNLFSNHTFVCVKGEYDLRKKDATEQVIPIDQIFKHPKHNPPNIDYDVALIKLKKPIKFNNDVRPVCLPRKDFPLGTKCYVTGWGHTRWQGNISPVNMTCIHDIHDTL